MRKDLSAQLASHKKEADSKVQALVAEFRTDMQTVESTHKRVTAEHLASIAKLESKNHKQASALEELKQVLQMAVKSDQRKDSLLQEVKVAFESERNKIAKRLEELDKEKNSVDGYKREIREENLVLTERIDALEYANKELANKAKQLAEFLENKEGECDDLMKENERNKKGLKQC